MPPHLIWWAWFCSPPFLLPPALRERLTWIEERRQTARWRFVVESRATHGSFLRRWGMLQGLSGHLDDKLVVVFFMASTGFSAAVPRARTNAAIKAVTARMLQMCHR